MKAVAFKATIKDRTIVLPAEQKQFKNGQQVKVIVLIEKAEAANTFQQLTETEFLKGYAPEDAQYDNY